MFFIYITWCKYSSFNLDCVMFEHHIWPVILSSGPEVIKLCSFSTEQEIYSEHEC